LTRGKLLFVLLLLGAAGAGWAVFRATPDPEGNGKFGTQEVDRGEIVYTVSANGTLNPVTLVNVGTQVSGTVKKLHADFNTQVKSGQVLAELDPELIEAQIREEEANLHNAQAALKLAQLKEQRTRTLVEKNFVVRSQLDDAVQAVEAAEAQVGAARAKLARHRTNLGYTIIRSPISGVVVARNVDVGQTVAASFQTPTLFQIAKDLERMQIDTSVAEADIGAIEAGKAVEFTVDAHRDQRFVGKVKQVRLNPTIQQNVVTYNVVVAVDNSDGKLLPGMTAHVRIVGDRRENALRVPNAALRYRPDAEQSKTGEKGRKAAGTAVYVLADGKPARVSVRTGMSDNQYTEIFGDQLKSGDKVIVGEINDRRDERGAGFRLKMF
jgi:HlyD family secretion protein